MKCHMKWSNPLNDSKKAVYQVLDVSLINTARPDNESFDSDVLTQVEILNLKDTSP